MSSSRTYSPADICKMFGISKSTLFRWEQEEWFPAPARDLKGERQYSTEHIRAISEAQKQKLGKEYERALEAENGASLQQYAEAVSLRKFLANEPTGLRELAEYPTLDPATIILLLKVAMEQYEPSDPMFYDIVKVACDQSLRLQRSRQTQP